MQLAGQVPTGRAVLRSNAREIPRPILTCLCDWNRSTGPRAGVARQTALGLALVWGEGAAKNPDRCALSQACRIHDSSKAAAMAIDRYVARTTGTLSYDPKAQCDDVDGFFNPIQRMLYAFILYTECARLKRLRWKRRTCTSATFTCR